MDQQCGEDELLDAMELMLRATVDQPVARVV